MKGQAGRTGEGRQERASSLLKGQAGRARRVYYTWTFNPTCPEATTSLIVMIACTSGKRCWLYAGRAVSILPWCCWRHSAKTPTSSRAEFRPWPITGDMVCAASPNNTVCRTNYRTSAEYIDTDGKAGYSPSPCIASINKRNSTDSCGPSTRFGTTSYIVKWLVIAWTQSIVAS